MERRGPAGSYWVVPGRLLAGMYPAEDTVPELLAAGVDSFFDLTEAASSTATTWTASTIAASRSAT